MSDLARAEMAPAQKRAMELLLAGKSVTETALEAGVNRGTLHRWIKNDPNFQAAYNEWQEQIHESARARMLTLADKATLAIEKALDAGDAKTAVQVLKSMQILAHKPAGPTNPNIIRENVNLAEKERKHRIRSAEEDIKFTDSFKS